jgi:hypothetical protein
MADLLNAESPTGPITGFVTGSGVQVPGTRWVLTAAGATLTLLAPLLTLPASSAGATDSVIRAGDCWAGLLTERFGGILL